jgi:hypothetical protein
LFVVQTKTPYATDVAATPEVFVTEDEISVGNCIAQFVAIKLIKDSAKF